MLKRQTEILFSPSTSHGSGDRGTQKQGNTKGMEKGEKRRRKIGEVSTASSTCGISRFPLPTGGDLETRLQKVARPQVVATNNQSLQLKRWLTVKFSLVIRTFFFLLFFCDYSEYYSEIRWTWNTQKLLGYDVDHYAMMMEIWNFVWKISMALKSQKEKCLILCNICFLETNNSFL